MVYSYNGFGTAHLEAGPLTHADGHDHCDAVVAICAQWVPLFPIGAGLDRLPGCIPAWTHPLRRRDRTPDADREIIDLYGVREEVVRALREEVWADAVPGVSGLSEWLRLDDLDAARAAPDGVVVISHYGTSVPCIVAPAAMVACTEEALAGIAEQMSGFARGEPRRLLAEVGYFRVEPGTPIWNLGRGGRRHARYDRTLWVRKNVIPMREQVEQVLRGERTHLDGEADVGEGRSPVWPAMIHEPSRGELTFIDDEEHWRGDADLSVMGDWEREARLVDGAGRAFRLEASATTGEYLIRATDERVSADEVRGMMVAFLAGRDASKRDVEAYHREIDGLRGLELIRWTIRHLGVITEVLS